MHDTSYTITCPPSITTATTSNPDPVSQPASHPASSSPSIVHRSISHLVKSAKMAPSLSSELEKKFKKNKLSERLLLVYAAMYVPYSYCAVQYSIVQNLICAPPKNSTPPSFLSQLLCTSVTTTRLAPKSDSFNPNNLTSYSLLPTLKNCTLPASPLPPTSPTSLFPRRLTVKLIFPPLPLSLPPSTPRITHLLPVFTPFTAKFISIPYSPHPKKDLKYNTSTLSIQHEHPSSTAHCSNQNPPALNPDYPLRCHCRIMPGRDNNDPARTTYRRTWPVDRRRRLWWRGLGDSRDCGSGGSVEEVGRGLE